WCTADIGWVTGHSYVMYGPLSAGATTIMYEAGPAYPDRDRFWDIVENDGVTIFYTAPTSIRMFMKWGHQYLEKHDLSSLRLIGSVGEPINPEAWMWYHKHVGGENVQSLTLGGKQRMVPFLLHRSQALQRPNLVQQPNQHPVLVQMYLMQKGIQ